MTQNATELLLKLMQICTKTQLPNTFRSLYNQISKNELKYDKKFYCESCNKIVNLENNKTRQCIYCNKWYILIFLFV